MERFLIRAQDQRFAVADVPRLPQTGARGIAIVSAAILTIVVDQTSAAIASTGLPYLAALTSATPDEASWMLTAFNAAYYAMILLSPWLMARVGRKRLMLVALVGFALDSLLLAVTSDYHLFVALRFVQGAFLGCLYVPAALLFFTTLPTNVLKYAPPAFVLVSLAAATVGTVIGASLADTFGGGSLFVPGALATLATAIAIASAVRAKDAPQRALAPDAIGLALSIAAFGSLQFLANEGERRNWFDDPSIVAGALVLVVALPGFVVYELFFTRSPHVDFRMFARHRNLAVGGIISVTIGFVGYAVTLFVGYLETSIGSTPTEAGVAVLVRVVTYAVGVPTAFLLISRKLLDLRVVVALGVLGTALGLAGFSRSMTTTAESASFVGLSLFFGFFFGMMNQPMGTLVIGSMPLDLLAAGVSIYKLAAPMGAMLATASLQTLLDHRLVALRSEIVSGLTLRRAPVEAYVRAHHGSTAGLGGLVGVQAQTLAYADLTIVLAFVVLVIVPVVLFAQLIAASNPAPQRS